MQFIKRFGKQLGFVVLISSAIFPVSSAIPQAAPVKSEILVNTDVIYGVKRLKCLFSCTATTKVDVVRLGGVINFQTDSNIKNVKVSVDAFKVDPFSSDYLNNKPVGGSKFKPDFDSSLNEKEVEGIFEEKENNILRLDIDYIDSKDPTRRYNPPALAYNGTSCKDPDGCVILHYGYTEEVTSTGALGPALFKTVIELRDLNGNTNLEKPSMASPILGNPLVGGKTQYLVVYHEQTDPVQPDVVIGNWTEFPVGAVDDPGQIQSLKTIQKIVQTQPLPQTLSFTNSDPSAGSITISNTRFLRSATQIPLEQLNAIDLPPTDPRFIPLPTANGTIAPGGTTTPVPVTDTDIIEVLDRIVSFDGIKDFLEIPNNENLNFGTGDLSISAWVKTTSTNGIEVILDKRVETTGPVQGYSLVNNSGSLLLQLADGEGSQFTNYVSNILIADGNLHHVAVTVDRDQPDGGRWYIDGVEVVGERFNPTIKGSLSNSKPLVIGRRSDNPSWPGFFNGEIGYVRLANRVLSSQEIQAIAANKP